MDIKQLESLGFTRAEIIAALLGSDTLPAKIDETPDRLKTFIGKPCVVRCKGEGVHVGIVRSVVETAAGGSVVLEPGSVRLWRFRCGGGGRTLSAVAQYGVEACGTKAETAASERVLLDACGMEPCTNAAWESIRSAGWSKWSK